MIRPILISATFSFLVSAQAAEPPEKFGPPVTVYGLGGAETCGAFIRSLDTPEYNRYFVYAAGFITGRNMAPGSGGNVLDGADLNDAMLVVEKFCRENPMKTFLGGLHVLVIGVGKER
jgi:hypothetical protein